MVAVLLITNYPHVEPNYLTFQGHWVPLLAQLPERFVVVKGL
jgi:hypothetical protein